MHWVWWIIVSVIVFGLFVALSFLGSFLSKKDRETDYTKEEILINIYDDEKIYGRVPYRIWQQNKLERIISLYSDKVLYNGKEYRVIIWHKDMPHLKCQNDGFFVFLYIDFVATLELMQESKTEIQNIDLNIVGNQNNICINQSQTESVSNSIEQFIRNENKLTDAERETLESFLYQLTKNTAKRTNAEKVVEILSKSALPLATAVINLIKAIFF